MLAVLLLAGCGGEPPSELAGFELGRTQGEVLEEAERRGGFDCRLRGTRPRVAICEGPAEEGWIGVTVRNDSVARLVLRLSGSEGADEPRSDDDARRAVRRFVRGFGEPAWRDRPVPPRSDPPEGYHTLWLPEDSSRALALVCAAEELGPPCTATLTPSSPAAVEAKLDTLLGIRR